MVGVQKSVISFLSVVGVLLAPSQLLAQVAGRVPASKRVVPVWDDITEDTTFRNTNTYLIDGEVHVQPGMTLTIQDGTTILIKNGKVRGRWIDRSALIFESGSRMNAETVYFRAGGADNRPEKRSDNGGIWFLGSYKEAEKDGVRVSLTPGMKASRFAALEVVASDLGSGDPVPLPRNLNPRGDDLDGVSVLGVGHKEWKIRAVRSEYSGDDGFDVTNSDIELDSLVVKRPFEDALNISSSRVRIVKHLEVSMVRSEVTDRDLFDLEVDDGPSRVILAKGCEVDLSGIFGDELKLRSNDLPQPDPCNCKPYVFKGTSHRNSTSVYSISED